MLVNLIQSNRLFLAIVSFGILGVCSKIVVSTTLNRLEKAASNMSRSNHKLMKLVKAKFEHASMANGGVENVEVFVDKYIREYKIFGMSLHSYQKMEHIFMGAVIISGAIGVALSMNLGFGTSTAIEYATVTISTCIILIGVYQVMDENYHIGGLRIYMVDYLENVLSSRFEKNKTKNLVPQVPVVDEAKTQEVKPLESFEPEDAQVSTDFSYTGVTARDAAMIYEKHLDAYDLEYPQSPTMDTVEIPSLENHEAFQIQGSIPLTAMERMLQEEMEKTVDYQNQTMEKETDNKALVRQILQEFMA